MRLYTFQTKTVYEFIQQHGYYESVFEKTLWANDKDFMNAYQWMKEEMIQRGMTPHDPSAGCIFAWYLMDGVNQYPDFSETYANYANQEMVCLTLEVDPKDVLLSDEMKWNAVLSNTVCYSTDQEDEMEQFDAYYESLDSKKQQTVKRESWQEVFHIDQSSTWVQATLFTIRKDQVVSCVEVKQ